MMKANSILLIDDNEVDNYVTKHILQKNAVAEEIIVEYSAMDALRYLEEVADTPEQIPDYIFLDIRMPQMDGFDFLDAYIKFPEAIVSKCIIFMLTSSDDPKDVERAKNYSCVKKFLRKPLDPEILKEL